MTITALFDLIQTGFFQSLLIGLVALGIMIPFRLLNQPDLTAEGSFPFGACLCAFLLVSGISPYYATMLAAIAGGLMGLITAWLYLHFRLSPLLGGIVLATTTYSINLRFLGGPNLALFNLTTLFSSDGESMASKLMIACLIAGIITISLYAYLKTRRGLRLRAVGLNPMVAQAQGINLNLYILLGFFLGNILPALAGALAVQSQGYADINIGIGILINSLAALMIGEVFMGNQQLYRRILAPFIGAFIYQQLQGGIMLLGLQPSDFKLVTGVMVLSILMVEHFKNNAHARRQHYGA